MASRPRWQETIQARNEADQAIYQAEKSLRDLGEKVSASDRGKLEAQMNTLKETMPSEDAGASARKSPSCNRR
jgi:molecular chaperone DnaK